MGVYLPWVRETLSDGGCLGKLNRRSNAGSGVHIQGVWKDRVVRHVSSYPPMKRSEQSRIDRPIHSSPRHERDLHVAAVCFILATVVAPIVQGAVSRRAIGFALIGALSIASYPRLKSSMSWWTQWGRGIAILLAFLLAQRLIR